MKRKHWQGYGTLDVKKIKDVILNDGVHRQVTVRVTGNHEYGIELRPHDNYTLAQWLGGVGKFKLEQVITYYNTDEESVMINGVDTGTCDYIITLRRF